MRKKRMKKTEDEIGRQSTSLNFLRVREKEKKRYKENTAAVEYLFNILKKRPAPLIFL